MSNCNKNDKQPLPIGVNKKKPGLFKDELGEKIIVEFAALRAKTYAYLDNGANENQKSKCTKKCEQKHVSKFQRLLA